MFSMPRGVDKTEDKPVEGRAISMGKTEDNFAPDCGIPVGNLCKNPVKVKMSAGNGMAREDAADGPPRTRDWAKRLIK
jgi:hypothetical protein